MTNPVVNFWDLTTDFRASPKDLRRNLPLDEERRERERQQKREYYIKNRDRICEKNRAAVLTPEQKRRKNETRRRYRERNKERLREAKREYYLANREKISAKRKEQRKLKNGKKQEAEKTA